MTALVLELQKDALDSSVTTADLLRKALVTARKLKTNDIVEWLSRELNGYPDDADVPDYRVLRGELKVHNPFRGWQPLIVPDAKMAEALSKRGTSQSVYELEQIANGDGDTVYIKLVKTVEQRLMKGMEIPLEPAVILSKAQIYGLLDKVRNTVLEWSLGLEEQGITGEGMSFSSEEKQQASNLTFNVNHLGSYIGSMTESQFQQGTQHSTQNFSKTLDLDAVANVINELKERLAEANLAPDQESQVKTDIACVEVQLSSPKPNVTIIKEGLRSIRSVLEGIASAALFQGVVAALGAML